MTTRTISAATNGPVTIDAALLGHGGTITVRASADCERATLTISTTDESGPAADAVRDATLRQGGAGLVASVEGKADNGGSTTGITGSRRGVTVVQNAGVVTGNLVGFNAAPIAIEATVPEGSSVTGRTQSADVQLEGAVRNVSAHTQSGDVRVEQADHIAVKTMSGDVRLGRTDVVEANTMSGDITIADFGGTAQLKTMSGDIRVHATVGGDIDASSMSGDVTVTATQAALDDQLDIRPRSMSGRISVPSRRTPGAGPRRRR